MNEIQPSKYHTNRDFEEEWVCPYCKKKMKKFIRVSNSYDKKGYSVSVHVLYGIKSLDNHREVCRNKKLMELAGYHIQKIECCSNCEEYYEDTYDGDIDTSCKKFRLRKVHPLGKCGEYKKR